MDSYKLAIRYFGASLIVAAWIAVGFVAYGPLGGCIAAAVAGVGLVWASWLSGRTSQPGANSDEPRERMIHRGQHVEDIIAKARKGEFIE